ncbi:hypothetical protein GCM10027161_71170 [Microbispora hainanensis]
MVPGSGAGVRVASSAGAVGRAVPVADGAGVDSPEISTSGSRTGEGAGLGVRILRLAGAAEGALLAGR